MKKPNLTKMMENVKDTTKGAMIQISGSAENLSKTIKSKNEQPKKKVVTAKRTIKVSKIKKNTESLDETLQTALLEYNEAYTTMNDKGINLFVSRLRSTDLVLHIEDLVNSIANTPKSYETDIAEIQIQRMNFANAYDFASKELEAAKRGAVGASVGVTSAMAIASLAPSAAMWVATTFGAASTGTAISTLSGAVATNAALAWLGGGALVAGGGGMVAGQALLAMAGPVGWGIAGVSILASIVLFGKDRLKLQKEKKEQVESVKQNTHSTKATTLKIQSLLDETVTLREKLAQQYKECLTDFGKEFSEIPYERQMKLGALVNNTLALAKSFAKSIN